MADGDQLLRSLQPALVASATRFFDGLRSGAYDGNLEASTAVRLASSYRYALGIAPLDAYQAELGRIGTPAVVVDDLTAALTQGIEELTRPVDAIKHQAKTVTVGISRSDETLLQPPLVQAVLAAGAARDRLSYKTLRTLADIDPAVAEVTGWIRYELDGDPVDGEVPVSIVDRGGIARDIPSRTERSGLLRGTKHTVAVERQVFVTRGREDGRTVVIVPETKDDRAIGLTLLHVRFREHLGVPAARGALQGYRNRWSALRDAVLETEPTFREDLLTEVPVADLLVEPIRELADRWRSTFVLGRLGGLRRAVGSPSAALTMRSGSAERPSAGRRRRPRTNVIGIGVDLCEVDRMRTALGRTPDPAGPGLHRRGAGVLRPPQGPHRALRGEVRGQGGGDEGHGGGRRRVQVAGDRGGEGPQRSALRPAPRSARRRWPTASGSPAGG